MPLAAPLRVAGSKTDLAFVLRSNVKIPPPGFELPPERIANGDVSTAITVQRVAEYENRAVADGGPAPCRRSPSSGSASSRRKCCKSSTPTGSDTTKHGVRSRSSSVSIIIADLTSIIGFVGALSQAAHKSLHVHAEHGDLVLIEGWELAGLNEIFADDEAGTTYWRKHVSVSNWPLLGCECSFSPRFSLELTEKLD